MNSCFAHVFPKLGALVVVDPPIYVRSGGASASSHLGLQEIRAHERCSETCDNLHVGHVVSATLLMAQQGAPQEDEEPLLLVPVDL